MASDLVRFSPARVATVVLLASTVAGAIWGAASTHERITAEAAAGAKRMDEFDARMKTLENKMSWQNDVLWEMRGDIKVLREQTSKRP